MRIGLIGCGSIGRFIAEAVCAGRIEGASLVAIADLPERADTVGGFAAAHGCAFTTDPLALPAAGADLAVEAAGGAAARSFALPLLGAGLDVLLMSVGALADRAFADAVSAAARGAGRRVYLPAGAIGGLDAVRAAALGGIDVVELSTRKPPAGLAGAPHFAAHPLDLDALDRPTVVFEGSAAEAIAAFPANVNVSVALSLAGLGPERTRVRVIAEPGLARNTHEIRVRGAFGEMRLEFANVPSPGNPRTSYLAALGALATLARITSPIQWG